MGVCDNFVLLISEVWFSVLEKIVYLLVGWMLLVCVMVFIMVRLVM